jgi:dihydrofolate reductase
MTRGVFELAMKNMGKVILGVTISMDGFAEDKSGSVGPLYPDLDALQNSRFLKESIRNTGSVVMAWKEFAMAENPDWFLGNYEYQVPIFVFTDIRPKKHPKEGGSLRFIFVTDGIESAVRQAKAAAGGKDVTIIGSANITQLAIKAEVADELELDVIPVFLREGFRPFENIGSKQINLKRVKVAELARGRTHLKFRIIR